MQEDIRDTGPYREVEDHFRRWLEPGFGRPGGAADPSPSPDGSRIAVTATIVEALDRSPFSRIAVAEGATGQVAAVTAGPHDDRLPAWSPDGSRLAFLSDRRVRGRFRLYLLEADRLGEARPAPDVPGTIESLAWSPDGSLLLLGVAGPGADRAGVEGSGTATAEDRDRPSWLPEVEGDGAAGSEWRSLWTYDPAEDRVARLSPEGLNVWEAAWCGPGAVVAVAGPSPGEEAWYRAPLVLIDPGTGEYRTLVESSVQLGVPAASPDGARASVIEALCSDRMVVAGSLLVVEPASGSVARIDTGGVDVTWAAWRDGRRLAYLGIRGLETAAGEVDAESGRATETWASSTETCGEWYPSGALVADDAIAVVAHGHARAPEVAKLRRGALETVASLGHPGTEHLRDVAGRLETVSWTAPDGLEIEGLLLLPDGPGPHPLVLWVHGGPVSAARTSWAMGRGVLPLLASRGYAVLSPNPRGSSGRGRDFAAMVVGDMGGADADDLLAGVDAMVERRVADPARLGVIGGSYGGFMSCHLVTRTDRFAAAVAISPVTDWYSQHWNSNIGHWDADFLRGDPTAPGGPYFDRSPVMRAGAVSTPTLLTAGVRDRCTPPGQAVEFYRALRESGVDTQLVLYPEEGHGVRQYPAFVDFAARIAGWFERQMPPGPRSGQPAAALAGKEPTA